jgi:hypothetical protein
VCVFPKTFYLLQIRFFPDGDKWSSLMSTQASSMLVFSAFLFPPVLSATS